MIEEDSPPTNQSQVNDHVRLNNDFITILVGGEVARVVCACA